MTDEEAFIRAFIVPAKRDRFASFVATAKRRADFTKTLGHFPDRDPRWVVEIPFHQQSGSEIEGILRARGAGATCLVISESAEFDGRRLPLAEALDLVIGMSMGSVLSCVPGRLAFYEGEGPSDRCVLARA